VAAGQHAWQRDLHPEDHAVDVDREQALRDLVGLLEERPDRHDARVVDQDVERSLRRLGRVEERGERLASRDVEAQTDCPKSRRRRLGRGDVEVAERHACTVPAEALHGRGADPARAAGDGHVQLV
jgi:hypothetical protein